jgi:hypothetical protein
MRKYFCNMCEDFYRVFTCEALCVMWLPVCVFTVVSVLCSFLLYSSLHAPFLNVSLGWAGSSFCNMFLSLSSVYFLYQLEYWVVGVDVHLQSIFTHPIYMIFHQCVQMSFPLCY